MSLFSRALVFFGLLLTVNGQEVPWEPAARAEPASWPEIAKEQALVMKQKPARFIFIGDSITEGWDEDVWKTRIASAGAHNFGIGGDGPQHVLWRIEHGLLEGASPEAFVLMIGINNFWREFTAADTARGIETIVDRIHQRHPESRILLLGLLPVYEAKSPIRPWIGEINTRLKQRHGTGKTEFLDLSADFLEPDGSQRRQLYTEDHLHLTKAGYIVLTRGLAAALHLP